MRFMRKLLTWTMPLIGAMFFRKYRRLFILFTALRGLWKAKEEYQSEQQTTRERAY